jgi:hypothetical protein
MGRPAALFRRLIGCLLAAGALLGAAPVAAQGVICCNHLIDVKGSWVGAGRKCNMEGLNASQRLMVCEALKDKMCPDVEKYCGDPCAMIDRLKGRIKGLSEAIAAHQKGRRESELKRHAARDQLWGKGEGLKFQGGSIARFGKAMLDSGLLATGGGGGVGKVYSKVTSTYDEYSGWAGQAWGVGSDPDNIEKWAGLGQKFLDMEADAILKKRSSEAIQAMNQHFKKTGNFIGAQNVYRQRYGNYGRLKDFKEKGGNLASALSALAELYEKTDKLANDLQDWVDAYKDMSGADKEIAKAEAERDRLQEQLSKLLKECGQKPAASLLREVPYPGYDLLLARATPADGYFVRVAEKKGTKPAADPGEATFRASQQALPRLRALQRALKEMDSNVGRQVFTPASPWLAGVWREAEPRELLVHLVKESRDGIGRFRRSLEQATGSGEPGLKAVQGIPPDPGP